MGAESTGRPSVRWLDAHGRGTDRTRPLRLVRALAAAHAGIGALARTGSRPAGAAAPRLRGRHVRRRGLHARAHARPGRASGRLAAPAARAPDLRGAFSLRARGADGALPAG